MVACWLAVAIRSHVPRILTLPIAFIASKSLQTRAVTQFYHNPRFIRQLTGDFLLLVLKQRSGVRCNGLLTIIPSADRPRTSPTTISHTGLQSGRHCVPAGILP